MKGSFDIQIANHCFKGILKYSVVVKNIKVNIVANSFWETLIKLLNCENCKLYFFHFDTKIVFRSFQRIGMLVILHNIIKIKIIMPNTDI